MTTSSVIDAAGVDYNSLDAFKVLASRAAAATSLFIDEDDWEVLEWTRGESAFALKDRQTGLVMACAIEGLGTKNLVAENPELRAKYSRTFYDWIAQCNIAMILNDLITIGISPLVYMSHPALAEGNHMGGENGVDHIRGTVNALKECSTVWGPGETPELNGIVVPGTMCLSGAAIGFSRSESSLINPANLRAGQRIVLLGSSGIHANGLSKARKAAEKIGGYCVAMHNDRDFGLDLLMPTILYVRFMKECLKRKIPIAYAVNITGHGWRKLMRATQNLTYRIESVPVVPAVLHFLQHTLGMSNYDAYQAFNMGAGFALMVEAEHVPALQSIGMQTGIIALDAGVIKEGPRQVIIEPLKLLFDELKIR